MTFWHHDTFKSKLCTSEHPNIWNPEIIIFLPCGFNIKKTNDEVKNLLLSKTPWHDLKAFKDKKIFITDGNQYFNRPGPRLIESLEIFTEIIHPNFFNFEHQNKGWINFFKNWEEQSKNNC